jgi:murein L,D-transpeptidase YcbB/YkuD
MLRRLFPALMTLLLVVLFSVPAPAKIPSSPGWLQGVALTGESVQSTPWLRLTINIPARELRVIENNQVIARYAVAIGNPRWPSPEMSDDINRIIWNPSWIPPKSPWARGAKVAPPGPRNPLGPVKMPIAQGILIHGTNKPNSVGRAASHGCFRMKSAEASSLAWYIQERMSSHRDPSLWAQYQRARYRTRPVTLEQSVPVDIVYRTAEIRDGALHLYPDVYHRRRNWMATIQQVLSAHGLKSEHITPEMVTQLTTPLRKGPVSVPLQSLLDGRVAARN